MMSEIRVTSWRELIDALYDIPKTGFGRHRSDYVYRGLADQSWDLKTSLIRFGSSFPEVERTLLMRKLRGFLRAI
jgi:hypothetical protein